ncbi:Ger(x)C family spore germination protein [Aureibacillus halotolerans]|uniref:Spore germination protein AC/spore germination protein BC n=1 Tax=Aureibacillus halotolerans TaxID=1508390 RepID=A0A4R6TX15_9BACI|nr:Ger(x)C family spore germination protein [Aureibacillus halotolerans]TDQ36549.1 spore germination protein AC/spore germination protein BC [Aureibacillus halotolerans]
MSSRQPFHVLLTILLLFLLTGCWDARAIEDVAFAVGFGYDKPESNDKIKVTYQFINTAAALEAQTKKYINITRESNSVHETIRDTSLQTYPVNSRHLKVLVIHHDLAEDIQIDKLINQVMKSNEVRRSCYVLISREPAQQIFSNEIANIVPVQQLKVLSRTIGYSNKKLPALTLGKMSSHLQEKVSFAIPEVRTDAGRNTLGGAFVVRGNLQKVVGHLNVRQTIGLNYLLGYEVGGTTTVNNDDKLRVFEVHDVKSKPKLTYSKQRGFEASFALQLTGRLSEDWNEDENSFKGNYLKLVEKKVEEDIKKSIEDLLTILQSDLKADVLKLHDLARIHHFDEYKNIKKEWDESIFPEIPIKVDVKATITDFGTKGATTKD